MKIVHAYDASGFYLGPVYAFESPLEPGIFLTPSNTTDVAPPEASEGQIPCWEQTTWVLKNIPLATPEETPVFKPVTTIHTAYFRAALAQLGHLEAVDAYVNQDPVKAQLWGWSTTISITDPDVVAIASALSIDLEAVLALAVSIKNTRTVETNDA